MDFAFSDEQEEFRSVLRRFFEENADLQRVRRAALSPDGFDRGLWSKMASELGLQGLHLQEAHGGQGFGFLELGIALQEMGRALVPGPFFASSVLAASAVRHVGDEAAQARWLAPIASGECIGALALVEPHGSWSPNGVALEVRADGDDVVLDGEKEAVLGGAAADVFFVVARESAGVSLVAVTAGSGGVEVRSPEPLDPTRRVARLGLSGARGVRVGGAGRAGPGLSRALDEAAVGLAAEAIGGADRALELAVAYAKERVQFARPIGSFQAVKHRAAEVLRDVELARAATDWALWVAAERPAELAEAAPLAKAAAADAFLGAAAANIQIHGGIGFTWEHDAHLFYKRAKAIELLFGDGAAQRERLADALGV